MDQKPELVKKVVDTPEKFVKRVSLQCFCDTSSGPLPCFATLFFQAQIIHTEQVRYGGTGGIAQRFYNATTNDASVFDATSSRLISGINSISRRPASQ